MKVEILGIGQRRSGTSKSSGKLYDFTPFYGAYSAGDVDGKKVEEITFSHLSGIVFPSIQVGDIINVSYDRKGYLEELSIIEKGGKVPQGGNLKINNN